MATGALLPLLLSPWGCRRATLSSLTDIILPCTGLLLACRVCAGTNFMVFGLRSALQSSFETSFTTEVLSTQKRLVHK